MTTAEQLSTAERFSPMLFVLQCRLMLPAFSISWLSSDFSGSSESLWILDHRSTSALCVACHTQLNRLSKVLTRSKVLL